MYTAGIATIISTIIQMEGIYLKVVEKSKNYEINSTGILSVQAGLLSEICLFT